MMDTVTVDKNGIHNTVSIERVTFAFYNTQGNDGIERDCDMHSANNRRNEDRIDENEACVFGEFPAQHIVKHAGTSRMKNKLLDGMNMDQAQVL